MQLLSLFFGTIVGVSLGLTGGGGAIFAVPLLMYGLGVPAWEAVGISLVSVGLTSMVGFLKKWRKAEVELRTGLLFATAGMLGGSRGLMGSPTSAGCGADAALCRADADHCGEDVDAGRKISRQSARVHARRRDRSDECD